VPPGRGLIASHPGNAKSGALLRSRLGLLALLARLVLLPLPLLSLVGRLFLLAERTQRGLRHSLAGSHDGGRCGALQYIHDLGRGFARSVF
jgi:hypothetical protein